MANKGNAGCSLIILVLLGIYIAYDHYIVSPREKARELQEQVDFWGQPSLDYFKDFNCGDLIESKNNRQIQNFFVLFSGRDEDCELNEYIIKDFENNHTINEYFTRDIHKANVIVWIDIVVGEIEGKYTNGASAIRNKVLVKLIDKESKSIFGTKEFSATGSARDEIRRKGGDKRPEYFGKIPYGEIIEFLLAQINR